MKRTLIATSVAVSTLLAAIPAFAAAPDAAAAGPAPQRAAVMFWFLDRNNDGFIDKTEIAEFRTVRFQSMDTNGDGVLTKDEATAALSQRMMRRGPHGKHGEQANNDDNGRHAQKAERWQARAEKREARMLQRLGFDGDKTTITLADFVALDDPMLKRADANDDGKISKAEFLASASKHGPAPKND